MLRLVWPILVIIAGASGSFVLKGTDSSFLLVIAGVIFLFIQLFRIYMDSQKSSSTEKVYTSSQDNKSQNGRLLNIRTNVATVESTSNNEEQTRVETAGNDALNNTKFLDMSEDQLKNRYKLETDLQAKEEIRQELVRRGFLWYKYNK